MLYATSCALASSFARPTEQDTDVDTWESTIAADILRKESADGADGHSKQLLFQTEVEKGITKLRVKWEYMSAIPGYGSNSPMSRKGPKKGEGVYEWKASGGSKKLDWDDGEGEVVRSLREVVEEAGRS